MISFKVFLSEQDAFKEFKYDDGKHAGFKHTARFGNHTVDVQFKKSYLDTGKHYEASFEVDGGNKAADSHVMPHRSMEILRHVHNKINSFIDEHKPKSVRMISNEGTKDKLYHAVASKLARKHGIEHVQKPMLLSGGPKGKYYGVEHQLKFKV